MDDIYNLLMIIREKPIVYLGKPSLDRLGAFLDGYHYHKYQNETYINTTSKTVLYGFSDYIRQHYNNCANEKNWTTIILKNSSSDTEAFYRFHRLLDEYYKKVYIKTF